MSAELILVGVLVVICLGFVVWRVVRCIRNSKNKDGCGCNCMCHPNLDGKKPEKK